MRHSAQTFRFRYCDTWYHAKSRFAPSVVDRDIGTAYVVKGGGGQKLAYIHYQDERRSTTKMLTKDETRRLRRFAKVPELLCKN